MSRRPPRSGNRRPRSVESANIYEDIARGHGFSREECPHDSSVAPNYLFLPWHRIYIHHLEWELRQIDDSLALPYWDWSYDRVAPRERIPNAFSRPTYRSRGRVYPNPLLFGNIPEMPETRGRAHQPSQATSREPGGANELRFGEAIAGVDAAMNETTFEGFHSAIRNLHDDIHVWIGRSMSRQSVAAYDPLFWAHHCNVDRLWAIWQRCHPRVALSRADADRILPGYSTRSVSATLDISASHLDYSYDDLESRGCRDELEFESAAYMRAPIIAEVRDIYTGGDSFTVNIFVRDTSDPQAQDVRVRTFGVFAWGTAPTTMHDEHAFTTRRIDITDDVARLGLEDRPLEVRVEPVVASDALPEGGRKRAMAVVAAPRLVGDVRLIRD